MDTSHRDSRGRPGSTDGERPNVLWVTLESVRADHTSLCGYERETTPTIDALGDRSDATVLDCGVAASLWTPASSASMLTGTHMSTHYVGHDGLANEKLPESVETLPQRLGRAGYDTALFSPNAYLGPSTGLDRGFDHFEEVALEQAAFAGVDDRARDSWRVALRRLRESPTADPGALVDELERSKNCYLARRVRRWLGDRGDDPFFCYAHVPSPHHPYRPVDRFHDAFADDVAMDVDDAGALVDEVYTGSEGIKRRMANGLDLSERDLAGIEALYDAEIRYADFTTGEILEAARAASDRELIVVVTGDHGDLFGERGLIGHNLVLHDGLIRVPMLVAGIDGVEDGDGQLSQHVDLTYTVAEAAGVPTEGFDGRDLRDPERPYAISQRGIAHFDAYEEHNPAFDADRFFADPFTSVRTTEYKCLTNESRTVLHDLPDETTDVSGRYPEVVADLEAVLDEEGIDWSDRPSQERAEFDEETKAQLADLGYLT